MITHKTKFSEDLEKYQVYKEDTLPQSLYFQIQQLSEVLTVGKNSFLIHGTPYLNAGTEVKIQIKDSNGNVVFLQPIRLYEEGLSRIVSIEIYEDTAPGPAEIIIMGEMTVDEYGQDIPLPWQNKYNVRWRRRISIAPSIQNTTPIRLYTSPNITVRELLNPYRIVNGEQLQISGSGSFRGILGESLKGVLSTFVILADTNLFVREMENGSFTSSVNGQLYTSSIDKVFNSSTIILGSKYYNTSGSIDEINFDNYMISYQTSPSYVPTELTRSFADIQVSNIKPFTGNIAQANIKVKNVDAPTTYEDLTHITVTAENLLQTESAVAQKINVGTITNQEIIDSHWIGGSSFNSTYFIT